jgi:hypothetical protein
MKSPVDSSTFMIWMCFLISAVWATNTSITWSPYIAVAWVSLGIGFAILRHRS